MSKPHNWVELNPDEHAPSVGRIRVFRCHGCDGVKILDPTMSQFYHHCHPDDCELSIIQSVQDQ